jgi:hypothetical protein
VAAGDFDFGTPSEPVGSRPPPHTPSRAVYVLLALVFGGTGCHNFYARRRRAAAQLGLFAAGVLLTAALATIDVIPFGPFSRSPVAGWVTLGVFHDVCCVREDGHGTRCGEPDAVNPMLCRPGSSLTRTPPNGRPGVSAAGDEFGAERVRAA